MSAFWSGHIGALQGAAAGYCLKVLLSEWCVCRVCALWSWLAGAAAGCGCRVRVQSSTVKGLHLRFFFILFLLECSVHYEVWVLVWLQGVAAGCLWQCGRWALMEITFSP